MEETIKITSLYYGINSMLQIIILEIKQLVQTLNTSCLKLFGGKSKLFGGEVSYKGIPHSNMLQFIVLSQC